MKKHPFLLEIVVFLCGATVMIFELAGARALGPYFGTSTFVWTAIIGIILGSLSLGYYLGGRIADRRPTFAMLSLVIFIAAVLMSIMYLVKEPFLQYLASEFDDAKTSTVISTFILFAPTSVFLGMVSPYAVKLRMDSLKTSGAIVGNLYSLSTLGSIVGTFLAGFYFIPSFGTNMILMFLCGFLFLLSFVLSFGRAYIFKFAVVALVFYLFFSIDYSVAGRIDTDTTYSRVWIYDYEYKKTGRMVKMMGINNENHSSMFLDSDELVNVYTKYYHLLRFFKPDFQKSLMLGGAAYSFPKDYLNVYPEALIDVVEIDPKMTELAKKYFRLEDNERMRIFHEDGRVYLNKTKEKYDVILGDAFTSRYSVPYQLTTIEAVQKKYDILNDDGVVILNIISAFEGNNSLFLRAQYRTYKEVFPNVSLFKVQTSADPSALQNVILVALKGEGGANFSVADNELLPFLNNLWTKEIEMDLPILTDDFAPVDYYMMQAVI